MIEKLHFKTHTHLKSIIGKDLINDDNIAILELVKNSYDANSKKVIVTFKNIKQNDDDTIRIRNKNDQSKINKYSNRTSRIVIQDFGVGMDRSDIEDKWLNIAYSEKKAQKKQFDRILAGAKGVGRFSCDRLGEYLNIYSRKKENKIIHLFVDWKSFEGDNNKNALIQNIDVFFEELNDHEFISKTGYSTFPSGTILEIIKLRSKWTSKEASGWSKDKLIGLKKQLEKLINPNQAYIQNASKNQNIFTIELTAEEFLLEEKKLNDENKKINGEIKNKIFEKLNFRTTSIHALIDEKGERITTTLQDKGKTIFKLVEHNKNFKNLSNTAVILYYLSPYSKAYFTRQMGLRPVEFGSIYLFINGFRIPPYGEEGDDWLKIEIRKGQGFNRFLGTREVIGRIEILDDKEKFKIISSREGIVKNDSYSELTNENGFFFKTFKRLEKYVVEGIAWDSLPPEVDDKAFKHIEKRIIEEDNWTSEEEVYKETDRDKFNRIYSVIHSVINAKAKDVISLYVNEDLIRERATEDRKIIEQEFEQILNDFSNNHISIDVLNRVLEKKAEMNKQLQKQLNTYSKYTTEEATTRAILELESLRDLNIKHENHIKVLLNKVKDLEEEKKKSDEELNKKQKEILFHQKLLSQDLIQLLEYHHNIGIAAGAIDGHLINLRDDLNKNKAPSVPDLYDLIENISYETNKIIAITNLATAANFNADTDEIETDLEEFVRQYIDRVKIGKLKSSSGDDMIINISAGNQTFLFTFKPLEIAIVLDNLLSNARKAKATEINVRFRHEKKSLLISFTDNGIGITNVNKDKVFDFGFTTTSGSGMGLYHIKSIMQGYGGDILLNKEFRKGTEFILFFKNEN